MSVVERNKIISAVSSVFGVDVYEIRSRSRIREMTDARKAVVYFLRKYFKMSSNNIAKEINRNHCVVHYMFTGAETLIKHDKEFRNKINRIEQVSKLDKKCCPTCGHILNE